VDFLQSTGQKYWQILPLTVTDPVHDDNPYHSISAFANNPLFISPELMAADGLIDPSDLANPPDFPNSRVDFPAVIRYKEALFSLAYDRFSRGGGTPAYERFCKENTWWLDDFALFSAIRSDRPDQTWNQWPDELRDRDPAALAAERERLHEAYERACFLQFVFFNQWERLKSRCRDAKITLVGDIPIYVDHDSADVWKHPEYFKLDSAGNPTVVSGVPPDYFSATGQLWNTPVYQWMP
jgi:4-alpha-glucanotransferase